MTRLLFAALAALIALPQVDAPLAPHEAAPLPTPRLHATFAVMPQHTAVFSGATLRFRLATPQAASNGVVHWTVIGDGSIDGYGIYAAPGTMGGTAQIVATLDGLSAAASLRTVGGPAPATTLAVISCYDDGQVQVRNAVGLGLIGAAATDDRPAGIAIDAARHVAAIAEEGRVIALDLRTGRVMRSGPIPGARFSEIASLGGGFFAATDNNAAAGAPGVRVFRVTARAIRQTAALVAGDTPEGIAVDYKSGFLFVSNVNSDSVTRYVFGRDGHARLIGMTATGRRPFGLALDPLRRLLFVADNDTRTVSGAKSRPGLEVYALPAMHRVALLTTGTPDALPLGVVTDPIANRAFVTNEGDGTVVAYSISPLRKLAIAGAGRAPWLPALDARRGAVYVPAALDNSLSAFAVSTLRPLSQPVGTCGYPTAVAIKEPS